MHRTRPTTGATGPCCTWTPKTIQQLTHRGLTLERTDDGWRLADLAEGEEQDPEAIEDLVRRLASIDFLGVLAEDDQPRRQSGRIPGRDRGDPDIRGRHRVPDQQARRQATTTCSRHPTGHKVQARRLCRGGPDGHRRARRRHRQPMRLGPPNAESPGSRPNTGGTGPESPNAEDCPRNGTPDPAGPKPGSNRRLHPDESCAR